MTKAGIVNVQLETWNAPSTGAASILCLQGTQNQHTEVYSSKRKRHPNRNAACRSNCELAIDSRIREVASISNGLTSEKWFGRHFDFVALSLFKHIDIYVISKHSKSVVKTCANGFSERINFIDLRYANNYY